MINKRTFIPILATAIAASFLVPASAQQIFIADPGLETAIRQTLQKPVGPLTEQDLLALTVLDASSRGVSRLDGLEGAHNLAALNLQLNQLSNLSFPNGLTNLSVLDLSFNPLTNCTFPAGMTQLTELIIEESSLTNLSLPAGLTRLNVLDLFRNQLTKLTLPTGLAQLEFLDVSENQIDSLTLPPDMTNLSSLFLNGNPFTTLVLPEPLADTNLAGLVADLRAQNVSVFAYVLTPRLTAVRLLGDRSFQFAAVGPPGVYAIFASTNLASTNLATWNKLATLTNELGFVRFEDTSARFSPQKFYRAALLP